jgi:peptidyl-prolyl cis-trans isomerase-like 1
MGSWNEEGAAILLHTTLGDIILELYHKHAPLACRNMWELTNSQYFDGTKFHRIVQDFVVQGGDPTGTGRGGESIFGKHFDDEISHDLKFTGAGILAMANSGQNKNGSQFFISLAPLPDLDGKHTIFGRVYSGMGVVQRLGNVQVDKHSCPMDDVSIITAQCIMLQ